MHSACFGTARRYDLLRTLRGALHSLISGALLTSCSHEPADAEGSAIAREPRIAKFSAQLIPAVAFPEQALADDTELRRGYGAVDMRFEPCIRRVTDYVLKGSGCSSGIVIYGPYVSVPSSSLIEVAFDVQPDTQVEVYADLVSQMGKQVLAGLNPQVVASGRDQRLGYFVSISKEDANVESRIGIRSAEPAEFVISNLTMTVR